MGVSMTPVGTWVGERVGGWGVGISLVDLDNAKVPCHALFKILMPYSKLSKSSSDGYRFWFWHASFSNVPIFEAQSFREI